MSCCWMISARLHACSRGLMVARCVRPFMRGWFITTITVDDIIFLLVSLPCPWVHSVILGLES